MWAQSRIPMDVMRSGSAVRFRQALHAASTIASSFSNTVFESQFWRRYCQTFSTGFSLGARDGRKIGVMLSGMFYMRLLLSRHDRALPTMVAQRISRRTVMDWGSSYPQRALHNLTYGPIAGRGTLDRNHNASCTRLRSRLTRPT